MLKKPAKRKRTLVKKYCINQCSLYKLGSIKRLALILGMDKLTLDILLNKPLEYREFTTKEESNPFSLKVKKPRHVQEPFGDLRKIQERILYLLEPVELPDYAHAAVKKRSYRTNAASHVNTSCVATFDLKNFYGSTQSHLVYYFFLDILKCSSDIAGILTNLTTFRNTMPTGSPLSPLLSLHAAKMMFDDLDALAKSLNLTFTCYIDDLTFSGKIIPRALKRHITRIILCYGYRLSEQKTRIYEVNDAKHVTGVVINKGKLKAPHSRFLTARNLETAINSNSSEQMHGFSKLKLLEMRAGLLGETSSIDSSFTSWAEQAHADLKIERLKNK